MHRKHDLKVINKIYGTTQKIFMHLFGDVTIFCSLVSRASMLDSLFTVGICCILLCMRSRYILIRAERLEPASACRSKCRLIVIQIRLFPM